MNISFEKKRVLTQDSLDGLSDVILFVEWVFTFEKEGKTSKGVGITEFNDLDTSDFTPYADVTDADLQQWVIDKSFAASWGEYCAHHENDIDMQISLASLTEKYVEEGYQSVLAPQD